MALTGAMPDRPAGPADKSGVAADRQRFCQPIDPPAPATGGDYAVPCSASATVEARAEQAFGQFRQRYGTIISDSAPIIRRAEVNGSTIYRVRVGPYSLGDANSVCEQDQGQRRGLLRRPQLIRPASPPRPAGLRMRAHLQGAAPLL